MWRSNDNNSIELQLNYKRPHVEIYLANVTRWSLLKKIKKNKKNKKLLIIFLVIEIDQIQRQMNKLTLGVTK